jgi:hypothetical protein
MPDENEQREDIEAIRPPDEEITEPTAPQRRRYFSRRNSGIALGVLALLLIFAAVLTVVFYRNGVFDTYVKTQFVNKMADIGIVFDADVFRVTVAPLQLELKTFVDCVREGKPFPVTLEEGSANLAVCERIVACFSAGLVRPPIVATTGPVRV